MILQVDRIEVSSGQFAGMVIDLSSGVPLASTLPFRSLRQLWTAQEALLDELESM